MPPLKVESPQDVPALIARLERERDKLIEQCDEAIYRLVTFQSIAQGLTPTLIEHIVWEFIRELPASFIAEGEEPATPPATPKPSRYTGTVFERIVKYFTEHDNKPASNAQVREAIGSNRGTVAMVFYNTHPDRFKKVKQDGDHIIYWQLSEAFYNTLLKNEERPAPAVQLVLPPASEEGTDDIPF